MFLTERQLADADIVTNIHHLLNDFSVVFSNSKFRFSSLAIAYRISVQIYSHEGSDGIFILRFCKPSSSEHVLCMALIYRKHSSVLSSFYENLETLNNNTNLNFIIGDFNLDVLNVEIYVALCNILSNFRLVFNTSSHLNGTHIDRVYVIKTFSEYDLTVSIINVYFSDHDA